MGVQAVVVCIAVCKILFLIPHNGFKAMHKKKKKSSKSRVFFKTPLHSTQPPSLSTWTSESEV